MTHTAIVGRETSAPGCVRAQRPGGRWPTTTEAARRALLVMLLGFGLASCDGAGLATHTAPVATPASPSARSPTPDRRIATRGTAPPPAPSPSPTRTASPRAPLDAPWHPARAPLPASAWDDPASYPTTDPPPGALWVPDTPREEPPLAFGVLPPERGATALAVREYALDAALPSAPADLPVWLGGRYPDTHRALFDRLVRRGVTSWVFEPRYSTAIYAGAAPLGEPSPVADAASATARAAAYLSDLGLLATDTTPLGAAPAPDAGWRVTFARHRDGRAIYSKSNLTAVIDGDGRLAYVQTHRRPLLAGSRYPARTPEDAWRQVQAGRGRMLPTAVAPRVTATPVTRFVVVDIELAYLEVEPFLPRQVVAPYYVFRDEQGQALCIPAVADPYVEWWP